MGRNKAFAGKTIEKRIYIPMWAEPVWEATKRAFLNYLSLIDGTYESATDKRNNCKLRRIDFVQTDAGFTHKVEAFEKVSFKDIEKLRQEITALVEVRSIDYGHPAETFARLAKLEEVIKDCPDPVLRQVLLMVAVKITRIIQTPSHTDSWIDIAGYACVALMIIDSNKERS